MRMEAEWEGNIWWSRKQCLGFVDQMLKRIQYELMKMPEQAALVVIHEPYSNIVNFVVDLENKNSFLTEEFLNQFGDTHLSTRWPIS
uniref:Uncharacterized protein n=1 Tax=Acrobeloides nanus TaxID=290746 RepID=A0A914CSC5_9BILA